MKKSQPELSPQNYRRKASLSSCRNRTKALLLVACGWLAVGCSALIPVGSRAAATPAASQQPIATATARPTSAPVATPTEPFIATRLPGQALPLPTPFSSTFDDLTVFSEGLNICVLALGGDVQYLTTVDHLSGVWVSPEGTRILYLRQPGEFEPSEVWLINPDGTDEWLLFTSDDIGGFNTTPYQIAWLEGSAWLMFNTYSPPAGLVEDLRLFNTTTGEHYELMPFGEGGRLLPSPDGETYALVGRDHISYIDADGLNPRVALDFPALDTGTDETRLPVTWWAGDSKSVVAVVMFNRTDLAQPLQLFPEHGVYIFRLPVNGAEPVYIKTLPLDHRLGWFVAKPSFSPDKQRAGYVTFNDGSGLYEAHVTLVFGELDEVYYTSTERLIFGEWLDDESFTIRVGETGQIVGAVGEVPFRDLLPQPTATPGPPDALMPCQPPA